MPLNRLKLFPFNCRNKSCSLGAMYSISFLSSASCSVKDFDSRTALSASSTLRPRLEAMERISAAVSFSIFRFISSSGLAAIGPNSKTGCAAPAFVPGAIAATSAASRMKIPAEPARLPVGVT